MLSHRYMANSIQFCVVFCINLYFSVCLPFQRQQFCTTKRAKTVVAALALTGTVLYNWTAWTMHSENFLGRSLCIVQQHFYDLNTRLEIVDTVITLLIPFFTISALNIRIIYAVFKIHRDRRHISSTHSMNGEANGIRHNGADATPSTPSNRYTHIGILSISSSHSHTLNTRRRHHNSQVKVTKMLVLVSSIFLVLNLPTHALRLYAFTTLVLPSREYVAINRLFQYFNYTNFAINFFLYNTCGRNFRHALHHLGRKIRYNVRYKCFGKKYSEDDIAIVVPVKRKSAPLEEDIPPISGQHNMSMHRCQSLSHSGSRSLKGSKGSRGSKGSKDVVEMRSTAVQIRSHHSRNSCHSYHSREMSHHSREFSHHTRAGNEFSHNGRSDFSHHSRYVSPFCSDVLTSSCSHRSLHRCNPL